MKTTLALFALASVLASTASVQAGPVKSEEAFDRAAGLFDRPVQKVPTVAALRFPAPTPPQVQPVLPPWSQQAQGAQTPAPTFITVIGGGKN
ncbi:MAG: hypothetical protein V4662_20590 [Verrucomicrobiota bacterium]